MKMKFALPLLVLSAASTALASAPPGAPATTSSSTVATSTTAQQKQYNTMNNSSGIVGGVNWMNSIRFSGMLAFDAWNQTNQNYLSAATPADTSIIFNGGQGAPAVGLPGASASNFAIGAALLNVDAHINSLVNAHVGLFYASAASSQPTSLSNTSDSYVNHSVIPPTGGVVDLHYGRAVGSRYYGGQGDGTIIVDSAYVDVGNFAKSPFMLRLGKMYIDYGTYNPYATLPSLTQLMTETRETGVQAAYIGASGIHGAVSVFPGITRLDDGTTYNYTGTLGYTHAYSGVNYDLNAGYIHNMLDVGAFRYALPGNSYASTVGGWTVHAGAGIGPWSLSYDHVASAGSLSDLTWADVSNIKTAGIQKASPTANNFTGNFKFMTYGYKSNLSLTYQWTTQASLLSVSGTANTPVVTFGALQLPKTRYGAEYNICLYPNTQLGFDLMHDTAYPGSELGTGSGNLTALMRLKAVFGA